MAEDDQQQELQMDGHEEEISVEAGAFSSDNSSDGEQREASSPVAAAPAAPARNHSYLPGTSNPLFPEELIAQRRRSQLSRRGSSRKRIRTRTRPGNANVAEWMDDDEDLPILELDGVVVLPGTTLPLRLRNPKWIEYIGSRIDANRRGAIDEEVRFGVITRAESEQQQRRRSSVREQRRRSSWLRSGIDRSRGDSILQRLVAEGLAAGEGDDGETNYESPPQQQQQSRNAPIPRPPRVQRQLSDMNLESNPIPMAPSLQDAEPARRTEPKDPLIGKIGTVVTVAFTQDRLNGDDNGLRNLSAWEQHQNQDLLVLIAVGTTRFRVRDCLDEERRRPTTFHHDMAEVRFYKVTELTEQEPVRPPLEIRGRCDERVIAQLSKVSPIPEFVFRNVWPWSLVRDIKRRLENVRSLESIHKLVNSSQEVSSMEPMAFSFWLAAHMPLSITERMRALHMESTVERLKFLLEMVETQEAVKTFVCCKSCYSPLADASQVFTVGGAEGTTGAYVNEHGVIHQTMTLREVNERLLWYQGAPETRESWFPGYAWTITYCRRCHAHLGWMFTAAANVEDENEDRPERFWGLTQASITMHDKLLPATNGPSAA